jgi:hypothetical protein
MYKRLSCIAILFLLVITGRSQLSVSIQEPPAGIVQKNQLWNLSLIYSGNNAINVVIGLTLVDINDNQPVLTAFTRPISLIKGAKQLRLQDISPVDYAYVSPAFNRLMDAFLPIGNYRACYTVYSGDRHAENNILSEDCISLEVAPLSPPQLTMPADSANIQNIYPQFSWLPPAPMNLFNDLNYDLLVTEVREGQAALEAIQENIPIYNPKRVTAMVNNYPSSNKSLDTGRVYAWRVIAKNGETFAAQSEVWTFKVTKKKPETLVPSSGMYLELKSDNAYTNTGIIPDNILGIKYYSYDKPHETIVRFLNERGEIIKEIKKELVYGNNFMVFRLDHSFHDEITYFIEISDLQMTRYRASFRMSKN